MRKTIIAAPTATPAVADEGWIDVESLARAELTSEDPAHPFENALTADPGTLWRAAEPGAQTVRLVFDEPVDVHRIRLMFTETEHARTQEFSLRWWSAEGAPHPLHRQQFTFSPPYTMHEIETYDVDLRGLRALELTISPQLGGGEARASLTSIQLA